VHLLVFLKTKFVSEVLPTSYNIVREVNNIITLRTKHIFCTRAKYYTFPLCILFFNLTRLWKHAACRKQTRCLLRPSSFT